MRIPAAEYLALDLEAHALLAGVPLRDVSAVDLPDGGDGRTIADVVERMDSVRGRPPLPVRALFELRRFLGRVFRWDDRTEGEPRPPSYASRLSEDQKRRSLCAPGAKSGPLPIVYQFPYEMLAEVTNATVHAFSCMALRARPGGYRLYWAIYVERVSVLTPIYMAMIEPFRRFIVYPALLGAIRDAWAQPVGSRA